MKYSGIKVLCEGVKSAKSAEQMWVIQESNLFTLLDISYSFCIIL